MTQTQALVALLSTVAAALKTTRRLCVLDLETTGTNTERDRIVEITLARFDPTTGLTEALEQRLNPGVPIPPDAAKVHGITDEDVRDKPRFSAIAARVDEMLEDADVIGYEHRRFDLPLIAAELARCGLKDPTVKARTIDVSAIFKSREPRTLSAAVGFFCGEVHTDAHGTTADVLATLQVLLAQFTRYDDLPTEIDALNLIGREDYVDRTGKVIWRNGEACMNVGNYVGVPLRDVDKGFLSWVLGKNFPADTKEIVRAALRGEYPVPPAAPIEA